MKIRATKRADIEGLQRVLDLTELFPSDMLPDMIEGFLSDPKMPEIWLTCLADEMPTGFCFARPEEMADGAWNMLAIAVLPDMQGKGCGAAITSHLEAELQGQGARILIADTSGSSEFSGARTFYASQGYSEEARIRDFWAAGEDKVTFRKALN